MPDIYPYPEFNQTTGMIGIVEYANDLTGGTFFPLTLLAMFIITLVGSMHLGGGRAFVYSSFFSSILAIFLVVAGLLSPVWMYFAFVLLGAGLMVLRIGKSSPLPQI